MALVSDGGFQHILRVLNTNVDGRQKARDHGRDGRAARVRRAPLEMRSCPFCACQTAGLPRSALTRLCVRR